MHNLAKFKHQKELLAELENFQILNWIITWQWQPRGGDDDELEAAGFVTVEEALVAAAAAAAEESAAGALRKFAGTADIDKAQIARLQHIPNWQCSKS